MLVMRAWGSKPQAVPPAPTAARNADLSSLPEVTEMLTAFQAFEEDAATAPHGPTWQRWVMVGYGGLLAPPGSRRLCELCRDPRSPAAEENGQAGDEERGGQFWALSC